MNQLLNFGKKMISKKFDGRSGDEDGNESHGSYDNSDRSSSEKSSGFGNPMSLLKKFDRDGDGKITENDFIMAVHQIGLGSIGESAARNVFKRLDTNHNGKLDFSEALGAFETIKSMLSKGGGGGSSASSAIY